MEEGTSATCEEGLTATCVEEGITVTCEGALAEEGTSVTCEEGVTATCVEEGVMTEGDWTVCGAGSEGAEEGSGGSGIIPAGDL